MNRPRIATVWMDGCSGCHMSFLDQDEALLDLFSRVDLVYSPLVDTKTYPEHVDVVLIEGSVSSTEDLHRLLRIRARSRLLIALGDCAITTNVPGMRNRFTVEDVLSASYGPTDATRPDAATGVPALLPRSQPLHAYVKVDFFIPGCPPPARTIGYVLSELLDGRLPDPSRLVPFG